MSKEILILTLLAKEVRWWYGLELIEASNGVLKRGTVYVLLDRMEDRGEIESRLETEEEHRKKGEPGKKRRMYHIKKGGLDRLQAQESTESLPGNLAWGTT